MVGFDDFPLVKRTSEEWASYAMGDFNKFLQDHANCERKASALCMSFVAKYSDRAPLIEPMIALAREELEHFHQVYKLMWRRGIGIGPDEKDPYINGIMGQLRHGRDERLLDRLVASALVEARGCERFELVSQYLEDSELSDFYHVLAKSEGGHYRVFIKLAEQFFTKSEVAQAVERIAKIESEVMLASPFRHALH